MLDVIYDKISRKKLLQFLFMNIINLSAIYLCIETKNSFLIFIPASILLISFRLFINKGIIIDKDNYRFKKYSSFLGTKSGKWHEFNNIKYLSLFKSFLIQKDNFKTTPQEYRYKVYQLNLFDKNNNVITLFNALEKDIAISSSKEIATYFNVPIIDATTNEHKYL